MAYERYGFERRVGKLLQKTVVIRRGGLVTDCVQAAERNLPEARYFVTVRNVRIKLYNISSHIQTGMK
jgi:hypothetical protein